MECTTAEEKIVVLALKAKLDSTVKSVNNKDVSTDLGKKKGTKKSNNSKKGYPISSAQAHVHCWVLRTSVEHWNGKQDP